MVWILVLALSISVLACGKQETAPVTEEKPAWAGQFAAGYGKADVTPS